MRAIQFDLQTISGRRKIGKRLRKRREKKKKKITTTKVSSDVGKVSLNYFRTQNQLEVCLEEVVPFPALRHVILRSLFRCFQFLLQSLVFHFISVAIVL